MEKATAGSQARDNPQDVFRKRARTGTPGDASRKRAEPAETIRERDEQIAEQVRQQVEQEQKIPAPGEPAGGE